MSERSKYSWKKYGCKKRKIDFHLTSEQFYALRDTEVDFYSGAHVEEDKRSIERIVSSIGYEPYNCAMVSINLNTWKGRWEKDVSLFQLFLFGFGLSKPKHKGMKQCLFVNGTRRSVMYKKIFFNSCKIYLQHFFLKQRGLVL